MKELFQIKYINTKNNFLFFSESVTKEFKSFRKNPTDNFVVKLEINLKHYGVFTVSPVSQPLDDWEMGINLVLAKTLKLQNATLVNVLPITSAIPIARSVNVSPASETDYEVLELNSQRIEAHLLDQLQVITMDLPFVVWPTPHLHITLVANPKNELVLLSNTTELHIIPEVYQIKTTGQQTEHKESTSFIWSGVQTILRAFTGSSVPDSSPAEESKSCLEDATIFRVHELQETNRNPSTIKIHSSFVPNFRCAKVEIIWPANPEQKYFYAQIQVTDNDLHSEPFSKFPIANISKQLIDKFNLEIGTKLRLMPITKSFESANLTIECQHGSNLTKQEVCNGLLHMMEQETEDVLLLNSGMTVKISPTVEGKIILDNEMVVLSRSQIESCCINISQESEIDSKQSEVTTEKSKSIPKLLLSWKSLLEEVMFSLQSNLLKKNLNTVIVVQGKTGSGKSSLFYLIENQLAAPPNCVHISSVDCRTLKGKQIDNLRIFFLKLFQECVRLQPSIALLENLEVFCPPTNAEHQDSPEAFYCLSVQELIWDIGLACCDIHNVVLVATTSNNEVWRWPHEITPVERFTMPDLSTNDIHDMLTEFLNNESVFCDHELITKMIKMLEGYRIQDLKDLSDRIIFNMWKQQGDGKISKSHVLAALNEFVPQGMRGVKLFSARNPSLGLGDGDNEYIEDRWANVGGLEEVKTTLTERIEWPSKYPELFEDAPLKLQTGVVLYGMPGSGKTLIAAELARSSGTNFISVKGPELLSKYIGASEQAVRDLFDKANSAKPCILFFDEFDSLAPSRGRDTTGVSDRVVNQLLTSLDGVDSLVDAGVWVIAATSRPDLLDKALLRPGRLDTILYCPLPSKEERLNILKILSRKLSLAEDVNLAEVADRTNGFSGADLQAILYSAQLAALEDMLDEVESEQPSEMNCILVTAEHITQALATTHQSLSQSERTRYENIYRDFERARVPGEKFEPPKQRTTLA